MTTAIFAALAAWVTAMIAVPPTIRLALARNLVDAPDECRRIHLRAVPRLGGVAVCLGAMVGVGVLAAAGTLPASGSIGSEPLVGLLAGSVVMLVVGLVDDLRGIRPIEKLAGQLIAAVVVVIGGFRIDMLILTPGIEFSLGWASLPLTVFWLVGVTNAFNLIDGLDGLASGVALVALGAIAIAAGVLHHALPLALVLVLAGALIGFLRHNVSPARIFLGDVGSLSVGLALAVLSVEGTRDAHGAVYMAVPIFALAFPLLDTSVSMLRRWLRGVPLSCADGRHVHHQLVALGLSHTRAAVVICAFSAGVALFGLSISFAPPALTLAVGGLGGFVFVLVAVHGVKLLHYHELSEMQASFASGLRKARSVIKDRIHARDLEFRLRRANTLTEIEALLGQYSAIFGFEAMVLCRTDDPPLPIMHDARRRVLRMDRPVHYVAGALTDEVVLRVYWYEDARAHPVYAERIVRMIAPALESAMAVSPHAVGVEFGAAGSAFDSAIVPARPRRSASVSIR